MNNSNRGDRDSYDSIQLAAPEDAGNDSNCEINLHQDIQMAGAQSGTATAQSRSIKPFSLDGLNLSAR